MSASQTWSGRESSKLRASRFGATGRSWRLLVVRGTGRRSWWAKSLMSHIGCSIRRREFRCPSRRSTSMSTRVDPGRAIGPLTDGKDRADITVQLGFCLAAAPEDRDRAQSGVEAGDAGADDPAQCRHGMVVSLSRDEGEFRQAIPPAKKAAALRAAKASAEPAAKCSPCAMCSAGLCRCHIRLPPPIVERQQAERSISAALAQSRTFRSRRRFFRSRHDTVESCSALLRQLYRNGLRTPRCGWKWYVSLFVKTEARPGSQGSVMRPFGGEDQRGHGKQRQTGERQVGDPEESNDEPPNVVPTAMPMLPNELP
jgi:hypothetical protein